MKRMRSEVEAAEKRAQTEEQAKLRNQNVILQRDNKIKVLEEKLKAALEENEAFKKREKKAARTVNFSGQDEEKKRESSRAGAEQQEKPRKRLFGAEDPFEKRVENM